MTEDEWEDFLDVIGMNFTLSIEKCSGLGGALQGEGGAGRDRMILPQRRAHRLAKGEEVALKGVRDRQGGGLILKGSEIVKIHHGIDGSVWLIRVIAQDFQLGLVAGQAGQGSANRSRIPLRRPPRAHYRPHDVEQIAHLQGKY